MKTVTKIISAVIMILLVAGFAAVGASAAPVSSGKQVVKTVNASGSKMIKAGTKYFYKGDGTLFIVVGHCGAQSYFTTDNYCDSYFKNMAAHGENVVKLMFGNLEAPFRIESGAGVIDPSFKPYFDRILRYAAQYNIYVQVSIWSWWTDYYPNFFADPNTKKLQKDTLTYLANNWGSSENIFAWELFNELPPIDFATAPWVRELSAWLRQQQAQQMICASAAIGAFGVLSDGLDFLSFHEYYVPGLMYKEGTGKAALSQRVLNVPKFVAQARVKFPNKPILDTEIPPLPTAWWSKIWASPSLAFTGDADFAQNFYDVEKAYLDAGAAGGGLPWSTVPQSVVNGMPNDLSAALYDRQLSLARYTINIGATAGR